MFLHLKQAGAARSLRVPGLIAVLASFGLVCAAAVPALAVPARRSATLASAERGTAPPGGAANTSPASSGLLLINGDRLAVTTTGGRPIVALRPAGRRDAVTSLGSGGQVLEIPAAAMPYLGHGLSPSLFQLSALERAESGGRLPVRVAFTGRRPAIPGVTFTRSSAGRASGYLTAASARSFGAALWRQFVADHARGSYGTDGLFRHDVSISLPGAPATPPAGAGAGARPDFPMHTLTVRATNLRGKPDTGDSIVISNVDNITRFDGYNETNSYFFRGSAKFSLPAGHYWAFVAFTSFSGSHPVLRLVVLPQFTVAGRNSTVRVSERAASSKVTMVTPRRSVVGEQGFEVDRWARAGDRGLPDKEGWAWSGVTTWVSPTTRKPTVGTLRAFTSGTLFSPAGVRPGYAYNLDFPSAGFVPPQHFAVTPSSLGAVTERYYQDVPANNAGWAVFGGAPVQIGPPATLWQFRLPQVQTQYFSAGRDLLWSLATWANAGQLSGSDTDLFRTFSGGQHQTQTWNEYPLHPAPDTTLGGASAAFPVQPSAARAGNTLRLVFTPFSDNQFGHVGPDYAGNGSARVAGTYAVAQDGRTIARGSAVNGIPAIPLSPRPSTVRFTLTASRHSRLLPLSPASRTVWTWRSARDTTARVPRAWYCSYSQLRYSVRYHRDCAVQPLMTLSYQVRGMSLTGLTRPGPQVVDVTAGHIQLGGTARVTGAQAQVSFNSGRTWSPATVTALGGGRFRAAYTASAGARVTLRISATDAAGGSIRETITRGYGVSR